jgi:uncharacterized membrane protein YsdA (DUF1294 family)
MDTIPGAILFAYILANALTFVAYLYDKRSAEKSGWRTPERRLLALALIGPFGAFGAMHLFRHKTRKGKFRLVPFFLCLHLAAALALALA